MTALGTEEKLEGQDRPASRQSSRPVSRRVSRQSSTCSSSSSLDGSVHEDETEDENENAGVQLEESAKGKVTGSVSVNYYKAGANWFVLFILLTSFVIVQVMASFADFWVAVW